MKAMAGDLVYSVIAFDGNLIGFSVDGPWIDGTDFQKYR